MGCVRSSWSFNSMIAWDFIYDFFFKFDPAFCHHDHFNWSQRQLADGTWLEIDLTMASPNDVTEEELVFWLELIIPFTMHTWRSYFFDSYTFTDVWGKESFWQGRFGCSSAGKLPPGLSSTRWEAAAMPLDSLMEIIRSHYKYRCRQGSQDSYKYEWGCWWLLLRKCFASAGVSTHRYFLHVPKIHQRGEHGKVRSRSLNLGIDSLKHLHVFLQPTYSGLILSFAGHPWGSHLGRSLEAWGRYQREVGDWQG